MSYPVVVDDKDLDDAALWAVIDSATASHSSSKSKTLATIKFPNHRQPPSPISKPSPAVPASPSPAKFRSMSRDSGEVLQEPWAYRPPRKVTRIAPPEASDSGSPLALVRSVQRTPPAKAYSSPESYLSPEIGKFAVHELSGCTEASPRCFSGRSEEEKESGLRHGLSGRFPSVSLFKEYQNAAMAILEKTDYTLISGNPFIKKSGWRKISCYFNISFEIRDKNIEFDENRNVQRAEFVIRAYMQGGRFSDGWGSCERREKRFLKPNHDIPSTAETRAKNKACQVCALAVNPSTASHLMEEALQVRRTPRMLSGLWHLGTQRRFWLPLFIFSLYTIIIMGGHSKDLLGIGEYRPGATSQVH